MFNSIEIKENHSLVETISTKYTKLGGEIITFLKNIMDLFNGYFLTPLVQDLTQVLVLYNKNK
jgi:hypothetical protein